jgi:TolB-like protein/DNA-binding winged helix-turn-helix (wHTH) protein
MMDTDSSPYVVEFEQFRFDRRAGCLSRQATDGSLLPVSIGSRAIAVLDVLVDRAGDLVSKDEIMGAVWPGMTVDDANLTMQIASLRRALDAGRVGSSCIVNIPGRGYRFLADVRRTADRCEPSVASIVQPGPRRPRPGRWHVVVAAVFAVALLAAANAGSWLRRATDAAPKMSDAPPAAAVNPASISTTAQTFTPGDVGLSRAPRPAAYSDKDRRLSVIVLPFENSSGDPRQDDLAAGITRDLTDRMARLPRVPVVPVAAAASYRGKPVNLQTIGRDYNVHFALTGNALRKDGRLIVSATLYEADSGLTLWSQRFDRPDNSGEWNGVVEQTWDHWIQASIDAEVARAKREHPESLDERDLMLAAAASSLSSPSKENFLARIALIERALAIDPDYVVALGDKANLYAGLVFNGYSSDSSANLSTAMKAADRALQLAPNDVEVLRRKALVLHAKGDLEGAAALIRKVLELEPLDAWRYRELGHIQMAQGHFKEALENLTTAKRLGGSAFYGQSLALGLLANDRIPEAIAEARLAIAQLDLNVGRAAEPSWLALIAGESESGQEAQARADLHQFIATRRTYRSITEVRKDPVLARNSNLLEGLRHAGMPEEYSPPPGR